MSEQIKIVPTIVSNVAEESATKKIENGNGLNILSPGFKTKFHDLTGVNFQGNPMYKDLLNMTKDEISSSKYQVHVLDEINFDLVILQNGEIGLRNKDANQKNTDPKSVEILKKASELGVAVYDFNTFH